LPLTFFLALRVTLPRKPGRLVPAQTLIEIQSQFAEEPPNPGGSFVFASQYQDIFPRIARMITDKKPNAHLALLLGVFLSASMRAIRGRFV
jgi:hypothetical protein